MNIINKQKFLAELSRLLTFMFQEDRLETLSLYDNMFDSAVDEQALLQFLVSPTRQAVIIARAYQSASGKLQIESSSRGSSAQEADGGTPSYILAIDELYHEAALKGVLNAPVVDENQLSFFEDAHTDDADDIFDNYDPDSFDGDDMLPELTNDDDAFFPAPASPAPEAVEAAPLSVEAPLAVEQPVPAEAHEALSFDSLAAAIDAFALEKSAAAEAVEAEAEIDEEPAETETEPETAEELEPVESVETVDTVETEEAPEQSETADELAEPKEAEAIETHEEPEAASVEAEEASEESAPEEAEAEAEAAEDAPAEEIQPEPVIAAEPESEDTVDKFMSEFKIVEAPEEQPSPELPIELPTEATPDAAADFDPVKDDFQSPPAEKATMRKLRPLILILYIIFAIPVGICGTALLLFPTLLFLSLAIGILSVGIMLVTSAFGGLVMFADILLLLGSALVTLALGVLCAWIFFWFIFGAIVGLIRGLIALGRKWCYKEVKAV